MKIKNVLSVIGLGVMILMSSSDIIGYTYTFNRNCNSGNCSALDIKAYVGYGSGSGMTGGNPSIKSVDLKLSNTPSVTSYYCGYQAPTTSKTASASMTYTGKTQNGYNLCFDYNNQVSGGSSSNFAYCIQAPAQDTTFTIDNCSSTSSMCSNGYAGMSCTITAKNTTTGIKY